MGFVEGVRTAFAKSFVWDDRAGRAEFWWFALASSVLYIAGAAVRAASPTAGGIIELVLILGLAVPSISVTVRRLHDSGRSGGWYWISLLPVVGGIVLLVFTLRRGTPGPNRYGTAPGDAPPLASTARTTYALPDVTPGNNWCENIDCRVYRVSADASTCAICGATNVTHDR